MPEGHSGQWTPHWVQNHDGDLPAEGRGVVTARNALGETKTTSGTETILIVD